MKKTITLLLLSLILFINTSSAFALCNPLPGNDGEDVGDDKTIIFVFDATQDAAWLPILSIEEDMTAKLPQTISGSTGLGNLIQCPVVWDTSSITDIGRQAINGVVSAPEGYKLKEGLNLENAKITVAVYKDSPVVFFKNIEKIDIETMVLPVNADVKSLNLLNYYYSVNEYGDSIQFAIEWDFSSLDVSKTGMYTIYGQSKLPEGAAFINEQNTVSQKIYVMESDKLDLGGYSFADQIITCRWIMKIDPALAQLELSYNGKNWQPLKEAIPEITYEIYKDYLKIDITQLEKETDYYFRMVYDNKYTGVLHFIVPENSDEPLINYSGDRDGGGGNDNTLPPVTLPLPIEPPQDDKNKTPNTDSNISEPSDPKSTLENIESANKPIVKPSLPVNSSPQTIAYEEDSDSRSIWSGLRIKHACSLKNIVIFVKNGVTVTFQSSVLQQLELADTDLFEIKINRVNKTGVDISIKINNQAVSGIQGMQVQIPYTPQDIRSDFSIIQTVDNKNIPALFENKAIHFTTDKTGLFTIEEAVKSHETQAQETNILKLESFTAIIIIVAAIFVVLTVVFFIWRRQR